MIVTIILNIFFLLALRFFVINIFPELFHTREQRQKNIERENDYVNFLIDTYNIKIKEQTSSQQEKEYRNLVKSCIYNERKLYSLIKAKLE